MKRTHKLYKKNDLPKNEDISKQIKSLYKADIPPWKVSRIALRKLKDRASV